MALNPLEIVIAFCLAPFIALAYGVRVFWIYFFVANEDADAVIVERDRFGQETTRLGLRKSYTPGQFETISIGFTFIWVGFAFAFSGTIVGLFQPLQQRAL